MEKRIYLGNAFSLSMLNTDTDKEINVSVREVELEEVKNVLKSNSFESAVGHQSTAEILSSLLELEIPVNRVNIQLSDRDVLYVFQMLMRLPEGKVLSAEEIKALPYKFVKVTIK